MQIYKKLISFIICGTSDFDLKGVSKNRRKTLSEQCEKVEDIEGHAIALPNIFVTEITDAFIQNRIQK